MASFEQNKQSHLWSVRFRIIENGKYKHKRLSGYKTKKEAEQAYSSYIVEPTGSDISFEKLVDDYITWEKGRIKPSTRYVVIPFCEKIKTEFSGKARKIKPIDIEMWTRKQSEKYQVKTVKLRISRLKAIFKFANAFYDIPNPFNKVPQFKRVEAKKEMLFLTPQEFSKMVAYLDDPYKTFITFLYYSGCRKGEAQALTWKDIKGNVVDINKTYQYFYKKHNLSTPKTSSSIRKIAMPESVMEQVKKLYTPDLTENSFVFSADKKHPLNVATIKFHLDRACNLSGVKNIRVHDLRHSHASYLVSSGVPITIISQRLGHANITQTYNTYSHILPNDEEKVLNALKKLGTD